MKQRINTLSKQDYSKATRLIRLGRLSSETDSDGFTLIDTEELANVKLLKTGRKFRGNKND